MPKNIYKGNDTAIPATGSPERLSDLVVELGTVLKGGTGIPKFTTAQAPAYVKGGMYFDTTLNKLRIGGATAWETVTSV